MPVHSRCLRYDLTDADAPQTTMGPIVYGGVAHAGLAEQCQKTQSVIASLPDVVKESR
jgi:hypothetical protein